jgi:hypothetical protein
MNKKVMWAIGAIIVAALVIYLIVMAKGKSGNGNNTDSANVNSSQSANSSGSAGANANVQANNESSLKQLLAAGVSQKCTFSDNGSQGTFYVSSGKSRGDFSSTVAGKATTTHMISDGKTSYVWVDGQPQGFKMSFDAASQQQANASASAPKGVDVNKTLDYHCEAWSADSSMFSMPANIQFMDLSTMGR